MNTMNTIFVLDNKSESVIEGYGKCIPYLDGYWIPFVNVICVHLVAVFIIP